MTTCAEFPACRVLRRAAVLPLASLAAVYLLLPRAAAAQGLEGLRLIDAEAIGRPWELELLPEFRFRRAAPAAGVLPTTTFGFVLGLPAATMAGARYTPQSAVVPGQPDEWEAFGRWAARAESRGAPFDLMLQGGFNGAAGSADGELGLARWLGPVRVAAAGRGFSDAHGDGRARAGVAAGALFFPRPRNMPLSVAADAATLLDREPDQGERVAWSLALNLGVSFTTHTLSVFATNTASGSLQGRTRGDRRTRLGLSFTAPIAVGRLLGLVVPRETAARAVATDVGPAPGAVAADIYRYAFPQMRLEVPRGSVIAWTNSDAVVHTVSADDGAWNSGTIRPGQQWRARFDEPGIYSFHCGPHPFMRGTVIVR